MIELVVASWLCSASVGICYDQSRVKIIGDEVATIVTDSKSNFAGLIVNCRTHKHTVVSEAGSAEGTWEKGSIAEMLCEKYLPGT